MTTSSLTDTLLQQLQGPALQQVAQKLGIDSQQAQSAVSSALPLLMGALGRNAQQPEGAQAIAGALQSNQSNTAAATNSAGGFDLGNLLGSVLGDSTGSAQTNGAGIVNNIFGGKTDQVATGLAQATGLESGKASQLLQTLAPVVMSFLAQHFLSGNNGTADAAQVSQVLGQEHAQAKASGIGGLLDGTLDQDGDGKFGVSDLLKMGGNLFKKS